MGNVIGGADMVSGRKKRNKGTETGKKEFGMQHDCFTVFICRRRKGGRSIIQRTASRQG